MAQKAHHLIDTVLPEASYRQWVLTLPIPLRFRMATNKKLPNKVHQIASQEITAHYTRVAKSEGLENPRPVSITFVQRIGSACNLKAHFHLIALEGVCAQPRLEKGVPRFVAFALPTDQEVCDVVERIATKTIKFLREGAGQKIRRVGPGFGYDEETPLVKSTLCATINDFNLHAKVCIAAQARERLLQLIKYVTRPPIANDRLIMNENGDLLLLLSEKTSFFLTFSQVIGSCDAVY